MATRLADVTKRINAAVKETQAEEAAAAARKRSALGIRSAERATQDFGSATQRAVQNAILSWRSFERVILVHILRRAFHQLMYVLRQSISRIIEFHKAIVEIRTISQTMSAPFDRWADSLKRVSDHWGIDLLDAANARYQILSNQIAKGVYQTEMFSEATFALLKNTKDW